MSFGKYLFGTVSAVGAVVAAPASSLAAYAAVSTQNSGVCKENVQKDERSDENK